MAPTKRTRSNTPSKSPRTRTSGAAESTMLPSLLLGKIGNPVLVLLAGYPDDMSSGWGLANLKSLSEEYRLICLALPGYEKPRTAVRRWGWDLPEIVELLHNTIHFHLAEENVTEYSMIVHDWGAYLGMCYQNKYPEEIKKMVLFDVGIVTKPPLLDSLRIVFYQWYFALSFAFSQLFSVTLANVFLLFFFLFISWTPLGPCPHDQVPRHRAEIDIQQGYPYWYFWFGPNGYIRKGPRNMLRPSLTKLLAPIPLANNSAASSSSSPSSASASASAGKKTSTATVLSSKMKTRTCPVFFMYGTKKNVMFHSEHFVDTLNKTEGCRVKSYDCGHWVILSQHNAEIMKQMKIFLGSN